MEFVCVFLFCDQIVFLFFTSLVVVLCFLYIFFFLFCFIPLYSMSSISILLFSSVFVFLFFFFCECVSFHHCCICRHLIYSFGFLGRSRALFGYFYSVINCICQLNTGAACVTLCTAYTLTLSLFLSIYWIHFAFLFPNFWSSSLFHIVCLSNIFNFFHLILREYFCKCLLIVVVVVVVKNVSLSFTSFLVSL